MKLSVAIAARAGLGVPAIARETSWSFVGSAQQYQGSLRNGTGLHEDSRKAGTGNPAIVCAIFQIPSNVFVRGHFAESAAAAMLCIFSLSESRRGSALFQG